MDICVIGAGTAGLTAGYRLSLSGHKVTVLEQSDFIGGQAGAFQIEGYMLDRFYHHVFTGDSHFHGLVQEMGLSSEMLWLRSKMGVYHDSKVFPFGTPLDLLRFSTLPFVDRVRFGLLALKLQKLDDWHPLESISATDWIRANASPAILDTIWGPLLRGKFGDKMDSVAMSWLWNKIKLRATSRSKGGGVEKLGYLKGGFYRLMQALADSISAKGGAVITKSNVESIKREGKKLSLIANGQGAGSFDQVLVTTPTPLFLSLCQELPADYRATLSKLEYQAAQTLVFSCKRSLSNMYWLNVTEPDFPFIAVIEHTNYVPRELYGGKNLVYVSNYLDAGEKAFSLDAPSLLKHYLPFLQKIAPDLTADDIQELHMFKDAYGQPVIRTDYRNFLPELQTPIPGLWLANTSQIYPEDRGVNFSVRLGEQVAAAMLE
jgi:protoporphyrinogen oxidase